MNSYVQSMSMLAGTSLWQMPHRDEIVYAAAAAGTLCLLIALALGMRAWGRGHHLAIRAEDK